MDELLFVVVKSLFITSGRKKKKFDTGLQKGSRQSQLFPFRPALENWHSVESIMTLESATANRQTKQKNVLALEQDWGDL